MNETKPTANAATHRGVDAAAHRSNAARSASRRRRSSGSSSGPSRGRLLVAPAAPAQRRDAHAEQRQQAQQAGTSQAATSKPPPSGTASTFAPYSSHERRLDLGLALALGDPAADELALAVGDGRGRDVQRRAALDAHHLVLDVGQRGPRLRGERRGSQHEREQQSEREPHAVQRIPLRLESRDPAGVVQWLRRWLPKPQMGVRFPSPALPGSGFEATADRLDLVGQRLLPIAALVELEDRVDARDAQLERHRMQLARHRQDVGRRPRATCRVQLVATRSWAASRRWISAM